MLLWKGKSPNSTSKLVIKWGFYVKLLKQRCLFFKHSLRIHWFDFKNAKLRTNGNYFKETTLDTIGNCQRPVFSLREYQHKITNLRKFQLNWSSKLWDNNERINTLVTQSCVLLFRRLILRPQNLTLRSQN